MSAFTILTAALGTLILIWAVWFIVSMIRYVHSGQYETDKRLQDISR